ncbi:hypothetical protein [Mycobacterium sp. AZCC_0083]|jgi:hypothetical protein|uniref:hypothetical protein n=1 Tax=Mycobacterium sp. AZCC_0083 TaxID=2735882 RepID=UPI001622C1F2|nr:hypothetical protein [Mycobacterium sp. AZCC_0083]MBB5166883.1 hypothetical protein [Mycobacterium sp. AZCC_0083]
MDNNNIHRFRSKLKASAATVGVGVFITMGVVTLTNQTTSVGTNSDNWKADSTLTITSPPPLASVAPTIKSAYCQDHSPHAWADGCPY